MKLLIASSMGRRKLELSRDNVDYNLTVHIDNETYTITIYRYEMEQILQWLNDEHYLEQPRSKGRIRLW